MNQLAINHNMIMGVGGVGIFNLKTSLWEKSSLQSLDISILLKSLSCAQLLSHSRQTGSDGALVLSTWFWLCGHEELWGWRGFLFDFQGNAKRSCNVWLGLILQTASEGPVWSSVYDGDSRIWEVLWTQIVYKRKPQMVSRVQERSLRNGAALACWSPKLRLLDIQ